MIDKYKLYYRTFLVLFWTGMCIGFICDEIPPLAAIRNPLLIVVDLILAILGFLTMRTRSDKVIFWSFMAIGAVSSFLVNHVSALTFFNGTRDFFGLLFCIPILHFFLSGDRAGEFRDKFDKQVRIWLILQAVCITFQFLKYGANDHGGGTMGFGGSGMTSILIYLSSFYLIMKDWDFDDVWGSVRRHKWTIILLYPTFLNETKISFILLAAYCVLIFKPTKAMLIKMIYALPVAIAAMWGVGYLYLKATNQSDDVFTYEFFEEYLVGSDVDYWVDLALKMQDGYFDQWMLDPEDYWAVDIQRMTKIALAPDILKKENGGIWLGAGLGQFKGGTMTEATKFARQNNWLLQGSKPWIFFVIIQIGLIGIIWFFCMIIRNLFGPKDYTPEIKRMLIFASTALLLIQFYDTSLRYYQFCFLFFYLCFAVRGIPADGKKKKESKTLIPAH
ncbi:MAG: hypothetical protein K2L96_00505 [Muribaculaceae bacterium]|nr:hypothetical protein [Muribaculaceae bacterium]